MLARNIAKPESGADRRVRAAADALCSVVERRMDELLHLVEEEIAVVRTGRMFGLRALKPRKAKAARDFITALDAVKKIRPALERSAPDSIYRLRRKHSEFRSMLQLNLAALATAKAASDDMLRAISEGRATAAGNTSYDTL
jgi:hypothetical protein